MTHPTRDRQPPAGAWSRRAIGVALSLALALRPAAAIADDVTPGFSVQTGFIHARFGGDRGATAALAGRADDGEPRLALVQFRDGRLILREIALPMDAVAIDSAAIAENAEAIFVLCAGRVLRIDGFAATPVVVTQVQSLYRGRSYAKLTAAIDFARDVTGDGVADLLIQDFDVLRVLSSEAGMAQSALQLPSIRRGYDRSVTYRPARIAPVTAEESPGLVSIRGNSMVRFAASAPGFEERPRVAALSLGLSEERDIEAFYNGYDDIDQSEFELREPELLLDIDADGLPDLVTLQTISSGVFDKASIYRIHFGRLSADALVFGPEPDTTLPSRGYQFGIRVESLGEDRLAIVSPAVNIGLRAIIGALFSRSVTLRIAIYVPDANGRYAASPSTIVKSKVRFDFGSGRVEFPTIAFGDLDADGRNDLLLKVGGDKLVWRRNEGDGQFDRNDRELDLVAPADGTAVHVTDMDGDGRAEVIVRYGSGDAEDLAGIVRVFAARP